MKSRCYAYIRTSTVKQGTEGVSLEAQRDAISGYARRHGLDIVEWFSETQTAAKRGRPIFTTMMKALTRRKVDGLILHRIDRGSRNLKDWSEIADLSDIGLQVHFAHDSIDLNTRGGRLAADVQAVVAADFIRNLREETRKGMIGRLKQGFYPFAAPVGYLDQGKAKAKTIDPIKGPLVKIAFELYATGTHNFDSLRQELYKCGLQTPQGKPLSLSGLTTMLNNPFYTGVMRLRATGELFQGLHEPLVHQEVFDRVREVLHGRVAHRGLKHDHLYRRDIICASCKKKLIGETQKVYVYYRCHKKQCPKTSVRERAVTHVIEADLQRLLRSTEVYSELEVLLTRGIADLITRKEQALAAIALQRTNLSLKLNTATDAVLEGLIDRDAYIERKNAIIRERVRLDEIEVQHQAGDPKEARNARRYIELIKRLRCGLFLSSPRESRAICREMTSNFIASGKNVVLQWQFPFDHLIKQVKIDECDPNGDTRRTSEKLAVMFLGQADPLKHPYVPKS